MSTITPRFEYLFIGDGSSPGLLRYDVRAFNFVGPPEEIQRLRDGADGSLALPTSTIEAEFGLHDCFSDGHEVIHGFQGDEVPVGRYDELMQRWRDFFVTQLHIQCGPVYQHRVHEEPL
jgi:hypothetical protein